MARRLDEQEVDLLLRLVGEHFPERDKVKIQAQSSFVEELDNGSILSFNLESVPPFDTKATILGDGTCEDAEGALVVITLLQRDGYLWRLDISRADGEPHIGSLDYSKVAALGFGQGVTLERKEHE